MADRQGLQKRLLASVVLLGLGVCFFGVAAFLYVKGLQWANEFSGVASLFVALAALFSPLARQMLRWLLRPGESADLSPGQAAEDLAAALEIQWTRQEDLRKINHPSPLPVRWQVTSHARAAMQGVSWPDLGKPGRAVTPSALGDSFEKAGELFSRLPWQRLVILGTGGSGKTMVAIRLARSLLAERASGGAVPVLLTVATWQPHQQTLLGFAASQLIRDHPGLGSLVKAGDGQRVTMAHALLTTRKLLLILDGADEIPQPLRPEAVRQISAMPVNTPLVVTSRTTEYVQAVQEAGRGLPRAAVVEMLPLGLSYIPKYLTEATAPPDNRWQPVFEHLTQHKHGQLAEALQTPLMIWLTRTVYAETNTSPTDLIPLALDGGRDAIEKHLMSKLVPAVYTPGDYSPAVATRWKPEPAEAWLRFVAHHLQAEQTPNFAWWDLNRRAPRSVLGIIGGLPIGAPIALVIGRAVGITKGPLTGLIDGAITGAVVSALAGLPGGLSSWRQMRPSRVEVRIRGNLGRLAGRLALGLLFGFGFGAVIGLPVVFLYGLQAGVLVALALGPAIGFALTTWCAIERPGRSGRSWGVSLPEM